MADNLPLEITPTFPHSMHQGDFAVSVYARRSVIVGAGAVAAGLAVPQVAHAADPTTPPPSGKVENSPSVVVASSDPRYGELQLRNWNKLYKANPEYFRIVRTPYQASRAVADAVAAGKRIAVRSGGHGLAGLVEDPANQVVIDFSEMRSVTYDDTREAFCIEPGATLGAGGHIIGGGVGALSRQHGLVSDHLHAVEVVHVNAAGEVKTVVATRDAADPNRDLFWAMAGGGGGNFGVVTRFWLRTPNVTSVKPQDQLPKRPQAIMTGRAIWNWADMDQVSFIQLLKNFGTWHEQFSAPGQRGNQLYASLIAPRKEAGKIFVSAQVDPTDPANEKLLNDFMTALTANVTPRATLINTGRQPWQYTTVNAADTAVAMGVLGPPRSRTKGALLRKRYTDEQAALIYTRLTSSTYSHTASSVSNATAENATASVHRSAIMLASVFSCWDVPADDARHETWNREFYRDLFADTGGVPVPNDRYDGCFVNWPDTDLLEPAWNTSGVPWSTLYYKGNYAKLQQVKAKYDPKDLFRHKLSVQLPA